jgi:hypothetical protein
VGRKKGLCNNEQSVATFLPTKRSDFGHETQKEIARNGLNSNRCRENSPIYQTGIYHTHKPPKMQNEPFFL